jgi:hypothetical protein
MIGISEVSIKLADGTHLMVEPKPNEEIVRVTISRTRFTTTLLVGGEEESFSIPLSEE